MLKIEMENGVENQCIPAYALTGVGTNSKSKSRMHGKETYFTKLIDLDVNTHEDI